MSEPVKPAPRFGLRPAESDRPQTLRIAYYDLTRGNSGEVPAARDPKANSLPPERSEGQ